MQKILYRFLFSIAASIVLRDMIKLLLGRFAIGARNYALLLLVLPLIVALFFFDRVHDLQAI